MDTYPELTEVPVAQRMREGRSAQQSPCEVGE